MPALDLRPRSLAYEARHAPCVLAQLGLRAHAGFVPAIRPNKDELGCYNGFDQTKEQAARLDRIVAADRPDRLRAVLGGGPGAVRDRRGDRAVHGDQGGQLPETEPARAVAR